MTRKILTVCALFMTIFVVGCAGKKTPVLPTSSSRTVVEQEQLEADKKAIEESAIEAEVRARAEQIKRQKELDDAKRAVVRNDTPEMREARRQLQREADAAERRRRAFQQVYAKASPTGCGNTIVVNPQAVEFTDFTDSVTLRVTNLSEVTHVIETSFRGLGVVVDHLCPGGSVSIAFKRHVFSSPQYENILLTAIGLGKESRSQVFPMTLYASQGTNGVRRENHAWIIR